MPGPPSLSLFIRQRIHCRRILYQINSGMSARSSLGHGNASCCWLDEEVYFGGFVGGGSSIKITDEHSWRPWPDQKGLKPEMGIICKLLALAVVCHPLKIHYNFIPLPCTIFLPIIPQTGLLNESTTAEFSIPIEMRIQTNDWRWKTWLNNDWEEGERKASFFPHKSNYHLIDIRTIWISCRLEEGAALFSAKWNVARGKTAALDENISRAVEGERGRILRFASTAAHNSRVTQKVLRWFQ